MSAIVRIKMECPEKDCDYANYGDLEWTCPHHGEAVRQPNRPYRGIPTPMSEEDIPAFEAAVAALRRDES